MVATTSIPYARFPGFVATMQIDKQYTHSTHSVIQFGELGYENKVKSTYSCFTDHF